MGSLAERSVPDNDAAPAVPKVITPFKLRAQLLDQGRSDTNVVKSDHMAVRLKVYASGGENGLHTHPNEDHMFLILDGSARFYDKDGNTTDVAKNSGVMLPAGAYYRFEATSTEPLVLLRVGCRVGPQGTAGRLDVDGNVMPGDSKANKQVEKVVRDGAWFE
jgi:mannose-6-phosphate isomerase-like protein (cupin superfamily)